MIFNTSHPSYFKSLLVEELWICNDVKELMKVALIVDGHFIRNISALL